VIAEVAENVRASQQLPEAYLHCDEDANHTWRSELNKHGEVSEELTERNAQKLARTLAAQLLTANANDEAIVPAYTIAMKTCGVNSDIGFGFVKKDAVMNKQITGTQQHTERQQATRSALAKPKTNSHRLSGIPTSSSAVTTNR
jgi:hypothetical protein